MSNRRNLKGSTSVTSSPASESGATPYDKPGGKMIAPCGQVVARANLSAAQAREQGLLTSGTYGRRSTFLSSSAALQRFLGSRLQVLGALHGSTLYKLTWKGLATPSGRLIYLLRASARRTSDNDLSLRLAGWVTPSARDWKDTPGMANHGTNPDGSKRKRLDQLPRQAAAMAAFGVMQSGVDAPTISGELFNPALSRWLLGLPPTWDDAAPTETR